MRWKFDQPERPVELLAAPVMRGRRYRGRPIYFSDIIVHRHSPYRVFADLKGATFAYNEPRSYSGYHLLRHYLVTIGEASGYFGRAVESGTHLASLEMVCRRQADTAAIDSTVLDWELAQNPGLGSRIRTVKVLGPSPAPPWVISGTVAPELCHDLRQAFLSMDRDPQGRELLACGQVGRFARVTDGDYDPIRRMVTGAGDEAL